MALSAVRTVRCSSWALVSLALASLLSGAATPAHAGVIITRSNERSVLVGKTIAGCNDEMFVAELHLHNADTFVQVSTGGALVRFHQDVHGTAIGSLGNDYVLAGQANVTIVNREPSGPIVATVTNQLHNVSEGSAANLLVIATTHTTYSAIGDVTAETTNFQTRCVG